MVGRFYKLFSTALLVSAASVGHLKAETPQLIPFDAFYRSISAAQTAAYVGPNLAASVSAFNEMRGHVLGLYQGVSVKHSFLVDEATYDCVPVAQQPSVRLAHLASVATPPSLPGATSKPGAGASSQILAGQKDSLGNAIGCASGDIPMRRVTMEDVSRAGTLQNFFQKGPGTAGRFIPNGTAPAQIHKYAHSYQFVKNIGGSVDINLWNPFVDTTKNEIFSLAQHWYTNNTKTLQTLEGGVQNYPAKYKTSKTVLFIYWTADNYKSVGCYNLDCKGFVQTNKNVFLGAPFSNYSTNGGTQWQATLETFLYNGNWWVYLGGGSASNAIGYYPGSVYKGGPMATGANEIDFGGETVGATIWPQMGSGQFPSAGFGHAAFMKGIAYFPNSSTRLVGKLSVSQPSPNCYKDVTTNDSKSSFGTYFYFGGPGGTKC